MKKNESIHVCQIESREFAGKNPVYPLFSSAWPAYAADPAHQATRTLSDTSVHSYSMRTKKPRGKLILLRNLPLIVR